MVTGEEFKNVLGIEILDNLKTKVINAYGPTECSDDVTHYILMKSLI